MRKVYSTEPGFGSGFLNHILEIAMFQGIEKTVSHFEKSTNQMTGDCKSIILLSGITSETKIQVFDGISIIPGSYLTKNPTEELLLLPSNIDLDPYIFNKMLMFVIDYFISPIFHNPFLPETKGIKRENKRDIPKEQFQFVLKNRDFSNFYEVDFHKTFSQALSLACNSAVQTEAVWSHIAANKFSYINHNRTSYPYPIINPHSGDTIMIEKAHTEKAKRLYEKLVNLNSKVAEKLQIPIDRWIKSKTSKTAVDKIIDLAIALESLYLSSIPEPTELSFRLRLYAAWYLREKTKDRKDLMKIFNRLYDWRSGVVHNGKLPEKKISKTKKRPYTQEEISELITKAQDLCQESIIKILEDGKFPDWNSLILGEESL